MPSGSPAKQGPVFRNTLILVGAQLLGTPLTILINIFMGRYLGAENLGNAYLAGTLVAFGFLFVDWGHSGVLPAAVAQDRSRAGLLLGSSLVWRFGTAILVSALLVVGCGVFGYSTNFQLVLAIVAAQWTLTALSSACQEVVRGFERTDVSAWGKLGFQVLSALLVIPALLLGGRLETVLTIQAIAQGIVLIFVWGATRRTGDMQVRAQWGEVKQLASRGTSFLVFGFALTLQGNVDAVFLSKLSSAEVIGWHAAAQRLSGTLTIPATALVAALYPTLARLFVEDKASFNDTAKRALRGTTILAVPLALCCAIYREIGIALYSEKNFGPASNNLLILSGVLFLVYFSMPLGTTLVAAGRQRAWAVAQSLCVLVSFGLNPVLIPWFQEHFGNGGLGVCTGAVISEIFMVGAAIYLVPKGVFDSSVMKALAKATVSGAAMVGLAYLLRGLSPFLAAPLAVVGYFVCLWLIGGIDRDQLQAARETLQRKLSRRAKV